jgi:hypothetical protein
MIMRRSKTGSPSFHRALATAMYCATVAILVSRAAGDPLERASRQHGTALATQGLTAGCPGNTVCSGCPAIGNASDCRRQYGCDAYGDCGICVCYCDANQFWQPVGGPQINDSAIACDIVGTCNACNCTGNGCRNNACYLRGGCYGFGFDAQTRASGLSCFGCPPTAAPTSAPTPWLDPCQPGEYYTPVIQYPVDANTFNHHCRELTVCVNGANYETTPPTATSDRICGGAVASSSVSSERLSAGADVGIGIAVLLVLAGAGVGFMYYTKSHKELEQKDALPELLLEG